MVRTAPVIEAIKLWAEHHAKPIAKAFRWRLSLFTAANILRRPRKAVQWHIPIEDAAEIAVAATKGSALHGIATQEWFKPKPKGQQLYPRELPHKPTPIYDVNRYYMAAIIDTGHVVAQTAPSPKYAKILPLDLKPISMWLRPDNKTFAEQAYPGNGRLPYTNLRISRWHLRQFIKNTNNPYLSIY